MILPAGRKRLDCGQEKGRKGGAAHWLNNAVVRNRLKRSQAGSLRHVGYASSLPAITSTARSDSRPPITPPYNSSWVLLWVAASIRAAIVLPVVLIQRSPPNGHPRLIAFLDCRNLGFCLRLIDDPSPVFWNWDWPSIQSHDPDWVHLFPQTTPTTIPYLAYQIGP